MDHEPAKKKLLQSTAKSSFGDTSTASSVPVDAVWWADRDIVVGHKVSVERRQGC